MKQSQKDRISAFNNFLVSIGHDVSFTDYKQKRICSHCGLIFRFNKTGNYVGSPGYTMTIRDGGDGSSFYEGLRMVHHSLEIMQKSREPMSDQFKIKIACKVSSLAKLQSLL